MSESRKGNEPWMPEVWFRFVRHSEEHYVGRVTFMPEDIAAESEVLDYQGDRQGWVKLVIDQIAKRARSRIVFFFPAPLKGEKEFRYVLSPRTVERIVSGELTASDICL